MRPFAFLLATLLAASGARADESSEDRLRKLATEAQTQEDLGHYDEALERYEEIYKLQPTPGTLLKVAQCHRELGQYNQAARAYRRYLTLVDPDGADAAKARDLLAQLESSPPAAALPVPAAKAAPAAAVPTVVYVPQPAGPPSHKAAFVLGGTAIAALAVGIGFGISSKNASKSLTSGIHSNADANAFAHTLETNAYVADLFFAGSGVLTLATVIAW